LISRPASRALSLARRSSDGVQLDRQITATDANKVRFIMNTYCMDAASPK
jgi:hypothetical protein